jgi:hypothetical protein
MKEYIIPKPNTSNREMEHMSNCEKCCKIWEMYFRENERSKNPMSWNELCYEWNNTSEKMRESFQRSLSLKESKWLKSMQSGRFLHGFHIFRQMFRSGTMGENAKTASAKWKTMTMEEKQGFIDKSTELRQQRKEIIKNLSPSLQQIYKSYVFKTKPKKRPSNEFALYVKKLYDERTKDQSFAAILKEGSQKWKTLTLEEKQIFKSEYLTSSQLCKIGFDVDDLE